VKFASTVVERLFKRRPPADRVYPFRGTAEYSSSAIALRDGRKMGVARGGPASRQPVLYFHGILGSRLEAFVGGATRHEVIAFDRPGYGMSDPLPRPSFTAFARDVEAVLDRLDIERCIVFGGSAGAPYALAVALQLGPRVAELFLVGGVAHAKMVRTAGLPMRWLVDFAENDVLRGRIVPGLQELLKNPVVTKAWLQMSVSTEGQVMPSAAATQLLGNRLSESWLEGLSAGDEGVQTDLQLLTTPWDFDHTALRRPVRIVHGGRDGVVPLDHARWYVRHLPGASLKIMPRHHHVTTILVTAHKVMALAHWLEHRSGRQQPLAGGH
jgi:pimeloyl-ACP methyl ester carboxylesterase